MFGHYGAWGETVILDFTVNLSFTKLCTPFIVSTAVARSLHVIAAVTDTLGLRIEMATGADVTIRKCLKK